MKVNHVSEIIIDSLTDTDSHILAKQCKTRVLKKCKKYYLMQRIMVKSQICFFKCNTNEPESDL